MWFIGCRIDYDYEDEEEDEEEEDEDAMPIDPSAAILGAAQGVPP